jgi:hypothetical protein
MHGAAAGSILERHAGRIGQSDRDVVFRVGDGNLEWRLDAIGLLQVHREAERRSMVREDEPRVAGRR